MEIIFQRGFVMTEAQEIYREAQQNLKEATNLYSKVYDLRRKLGFNNNGYHIPPKEVSNIKKNIVTLKNEEGKCRKKYKSLMKKIKWDPANGRYRLKSAAEKIAEAARRK
jgi:hypothetical protein